MVGFIKTAATRAPLVMNCQLCGVVELNREILMRCV